ncbi:hypothetical protein HanIR_Chr17g0886001 [Helianthus annuus]|nr:hypothetical protein HanIR_Chr17g0886001 [Helianthus annuus]
MCRLFMVTVGYTDHYHSSRRIRGQRSSYRTWIVWKGGHLVCIRMLNLVH